mgnify:FL=1|tara:strand:- start:5342 stop:6133 length:792 start_codon:yes stop_codon:yes gene_type:complete
MSVSIHPTAIVSGDAKIAENVSIGPFSIIGPNVEIMANCKIGAQVHIDGHTVIGESNTFESFCSIGAPPQDTSYKGEPTRTVIGSGNTFREYVSIHRGTMKDNGITNVGNNSLFMAYVHLGHDVQFGSNCVVANSTNFAGHVKVGDRVIIGGGSQISQFVSIGRGAYIGGATAIDRDIPIFCTAYGNRVKLKGVNIIGMRRQGVDKPMISEVLDFYRTMEASALSPRAFVEHEEHMAEFAGNAIIAEMVAFIRVSEVGIAPFL